MSSEHNHPHPFGLDAPLAHLFHRAAPELHLPEPSADPPLLTVEVILDDSDPVVSRTLVVRSEITAERLHVLLQAAMGWEDMKLHAFWPGPTKRVWVGPFLQADGVDVDEDGQDYPHEREVQLDQLLRAPSDRLYYTYDFGDSWCLTLTVADAEPCPPDAPEAMCIAARGADVIEDAGGTAAFNALVARHAQGTPGGTDGLLVPPGWDPDRVDLEAINARLAVAQLPGEIVTAMLAQLPPAVPQLTQLLDRAPQDLVLELTRFAAEAVPLATAGELGGSPPGHAGLDPHVLAEAVRPWIRLVEWLGADGVALTAAGWLPPSLVRGLALDLGWDRLEQGQLNRENQTPSIHALRDSAMKAGLVRKYAGRLAVTSRARGYRSDPVAYWRRLAATVMPKRDDFGVDATVLMLLYAGGTGQWTQGAEGTATALTLVGWERTDHTPVASWDVLAGSERAGSILRLCGALPWHQRAGNRQLVRAFVRDALFET